MRQFHLDATDIILLINAAEYAIEQVETSAGDINIFLPGLENNPDDQLKIARDQMTELIARLERVLKAANHEEVHLII